MSPERREAWREAMAVDEERRRRRPADQRATLRRVTVGAAVAAASLNAALFVQTGIQQVGPDDFQKAIVSAIAGVFPASGLQPSSPTPRPSPSGAGIVTTGGS